MYNQAGSQSSILGAIIPNGYITGATQRFYYESNNTDDCGLIIYYPTNNYITVTITNMDGSGVTNFPSGYILQLCFTVIE